MRYMGRLTYFGANIAEVVISSVVLGQDRSGWVVSVAALTIGMTRALDEVLLQCHIGIERLYRITSGQHRET